jgi:hypothetical protein
MAASSSKFSSTLTSFCDELRQTFPELAAPIARVAAATPAQFWKMWRSHLDILVDCDGPALFSERKGLVIGVVQLTPALWSEISDKTQEAIWRYLRTLILEAALENNLENIETADMQKLIDIMNAERGDPASVLEETMDHLKPLLERMKGLIGSGFSGFSSIPGFSNFMDVSAAFAGFADLSGMSFPEIPERLRNGRIAKLAEEMAKQFNPADFGIDPALFAGDNVEKVLTGLAEMYQRDPSKLMEGAQRIAEKIKKQILGGSLNREELVAEAQEFIALFKDHPMFKEILGKVEGLMGPGGLADLLGGSGLGSSGSAPSERRRAVQERLRKKLAARNNKK